MILLLWIVEISLNLELPFKCVNYYDDRCSSSSLSSLLHYPVINTNRSTTQSQSLLHRPSPLLPSPLSNYTISEK